MSKKRRNNSKADGTPEVVNRRARFEYDIEETIEVGVRLVGTEVKSVRAGKVSLAEGYVRATEDPPRMELHGVHIAEYPPAGAFQHPPTRVRTLLAHKKEIVKFATRSQVKGMSIVPLKLYFKGGFAKIQIGVGRGKGKSDKRETIKKREADRDIMRAMSKRV